MRTSLEISFNPVIDLKARSLIDMSKNISKTYLSGF